METTLNIIILVAYKSKISSVAQIFIIELRRLPNLKKKICRVEKQTFLVIGRPASNGVCLLDMLCLSDVMEQLHDQMELF